MSRLGDDILSLVRIPSVTGHERAIADELETRLAREAAGRGNRVERRDDSLLVVPEERGDRPLIVLAGHLDTVPKGEAADPRLEDGRVVGRGACDMKAGVAVMLNLAERLPARDGFAARAYVFYTGEEGSAAGNSLGALLRSEPWIRGADLGILLEPTSGQLELGCNGSIHLELTFPGQACHSARPWMGRHPLKSALPWLAATLERPAREAEIAGVVFREVVTLTTLRAGEARNVVPGSMCVNLNFRYPPDRTPQEAEALALSFCPPEAEVAVLDHSPAARIDLDAPLYRYLCESTALPRRAKQGWTDVARLTAHGVPALNWGPGDPGMAHTKDEFVEVANADACLEAMERFFLSRGPVG